MRGVGGLCCGALLARAGHRVLVVEQADRVGGRASTHEEDGFLINDGAVALERGGAMEAVFRAVGAPFAVRDIPAGDIVLRIRGRDVPMSGRVLDALYDRALRPALARAARRARPDATFADWVAGLTGSATVHRICRNVTAGFYACNSDEVPARVILHYLATKSAFRRLALHPAGTIGPLRALADAIVRDGGEVWLNAEATGFDVADGRVEAVTVRRGGAPVRVACAAVVSSAGPDVTARLAGLPEPKIDRLPMFALNFASRERLLGKRAVLFLGDTTRVATIACVTAVCPELAPPGWHLYVANAVPVPALGAFDAEAELDVALAELRAQLPGFARARVLSTPLAWPVYGRAGAERDHATPLPNLFDVGDATRDYSDAGMQGAAASSQRVFPRVQAALAHRPRQPIGW